MKNAAAIVVAFISSIPALCLAGAPLACKSWPTNVAMSYLRNAGITDFAKLDESKTRAVRLASEKVGKDLWRDIYDITFHEHGGRVIEVITSSTASSEECSMSSPVIWVVSSKSGDK